MNKNFSEKQKHNIDYKKSHNDETQSQREHITKIIIFFNVVFILQRKSVEIMQECQIAL